MKRQKKPARPPGGGSLDAILMGVTSLHSSIRPLQRPGGRGFGGAGGSGVDLDVEALQGFVRVARAPAGPPQAAGKVEPCRNPECPGRGEKPSFEEDRRKGDRICQHCGATSRLRPEEEEHRSFAEDDGKSENRKRAETQAPGRSGARVGDKNLARVSMIAASAAEVHPRPRRHPCRRPLTTRGRGRSQQHTRSRSRVRRALDVYPRVRPPPLPPSIPSPVAPTLAPTLAPIRRANDVVSRSVAQGDSDMADKDQKRLAAYKEKISSLTSGQFTQAQTGIPRQVPNRLLDC